MINVNRGPQPSSLSSPKVTEYLQGLSIYQALPENQKATAAKPTCSFEYRQTDVLEAFDRDFYSKCYLTEKWFVNSYAMDIDHFKSKVLFPELTYAWENLYPADHDANMLKPRQEPSDGYLDPCSPEDDVERAIIYSIGLGDDGIDFTARDSDNKKALNTAYLLQKLHNGVSDEGKKKTATLRYLIMKRRGKILALITDWLAAKNSNNREKEAWHEAELRKLLSRRSAFTMLMRSIEAVKAHIPTDFLD